MVRLADITDYKQAVIALEGALERERETTAIYRNFVAMVSHQFRTPLAIIDSSAQRLVRRGAPAFEEVAQRANTIRKATRRLTELVDNTLSAARLDAGRIECRPRPCDFAALAADACTRQREATPDRRITFEPPDEPLFLPCDPALMEHVLGNLLSNAVKYSPPETPITVRCTTEDGTARCAVTDQGIGIPAEEVPRLFERFFRARTALRVTGTGLGLTLARHIAELHGGTIVVESREGAGSTFTLVLPLPATTPAAQDAA